jgi:hypothetical protein
MMRPGSLLDPVMGLKLEAGADEPSGAPRTTKGYPEPVTNNLATVTEIVQRMEARSRSIDASLKDADDRFERSMQDLRDAVAEIGRARNRR